MVTFKSNVLVGVTFGVVALLIGGVVANEINSPRSIQFQSPKLGTHISNGLTTNLNASWADMYQSVKDLKAHADIAVLGHFSQVIGQTIDEVGIPYTDFALSVDSVLYDPNSKVAGPGSVLRVHQTGGVIANVTQQISDDPLFAVDEKVALFLREYKPGFFMVIGGPTGRFEESNAMDIVPSSSEGVKFSGNVETFTSMVRSTQ